LGLKVEEKQKREEEKKDKNYSYRSYSARFSGYSEYFSFSAPVDAAKAKATFKNGILEVRVPKLAKAKGRELRIE